MLAIATGSEKCGPKTIKVLQMSEPFPPWERDHLALRVSCYAKAGLTDLFQKAQQDYANFIDAVPEPLAK